MSECIDFVEIPTMLHYLVYILRCRMS